MEAAVLISPQNNTSIVLSPESQSNPGLTLVWNHGNYDVSTEINYEIEAAAGGTNFADTLSINTVTARVYPLTVAELNSLALQAGIEPFEEGKLDFRVVSSLGTAHEMKMVSNVISINVTPYTTENPKLFLRGNFTNASGYGADWGGTTTPPFLQAAAYGETAFEGFIYMNVAEPEFKFIPNAVDFAGDYGDAAASGFSGTLVQEGETNIKPGAPGYYYIKADTDLLTYSAVPTAWGVVGNATPGGWENSTPMTYDATTKKWTVTVALVPQVAPDNGWKFRANNAWTYNMGDTTLNSTDGTLKFDGTNIGVTTAGTYKITLDLSNPRAYSYTIERQ